MKKYLTLSLFLFSASTIPASGACFDVSKSEPHQLTGTLRYIVFPGPPNYEDVRKGDMPEPAYILRIASQICITGDEFADPMTFFSEVHLGASANATQKLKSFVNKEVNVTLRDPFGAHTAHHRRPLVASIRDISLAAASRDITDEYGTAASTIRAFYSYLSAGQGYDASMMIVPEKRQSGPFSGENLSRFYGSLQQPLELQDVIQNSNTEFFVRYRFAMKSKTCNGRAIIQTVVRNGNNLIQSVRALDGC
jgi:hypothetical protein